MPIETLQQLRVAMADNGAQQIYVKRLAANDNSKQQVYLGSDFSTLNIIPHGEILAESAVKTPNFKAPLTFSWITSEGQAAPAPRAQLILYPDYPEVRLSGFLMGCATSPSATMNNRAPGRLLCLGICEDGRVLAYVAPHDSVITQEFEAFGDLPMSGVFFVVPPLQTGKVDTKNTLLIELGRIHRLGWIDSKRLQSDGSTMLYTAQNGGGYTLEAELKITPNGYSEPDYLGWEVKQYNVPSITTPERGKVITLMTTEPNGGVYHQDFSQFMHVYGYPDATTADRLNFGGVHLVGQRHARTNLLLELRGYDASLEKITDVNGGLHLVDLNGNSAASWDFQGLIGHWGRKHNQAVYVPCEALSEGALKRYRYGEQVRLGEQTDAILFIKALSSAIVYYDPAPKLEGISTPKPRAKKRNQFRIKFPNLGPLYKSYSVAQVR